MFINRFSDDVRANFEPSHKHIKASLSIFIPEANVYFIDELEKGHWHSDP